MVIVHSHVKLSECKQHQNGASLASIAVNANPKPRLSNVVSWKIPELNGGVNGKTIELNAGLCRKPCLMKPEGKMMFFFASQKSEFSAAATQVVLQVKSGFHQGMVRNRESPTRMENVFEC